MKHKSSYCTHIYLMVYRSFLWGLARWHDKIGPVVMLSFSTDFPFEEGRRRRSSGFPQDMTGYRATIGSKTGKSSVPPSHHVPPSRPRTQSSHSEPDVQMIAVSSGDVLQMQDERFSDLLKELNARQQSFSSAWWLGGIALVLGAALMNLLGPLAMVAFSSRTEPCLATLRSSATPGSNTIRTEDLTGVLRTTIRFPFASTRAST